MMNSVFKYNTYRDILPHQGARRFASHARFAAAHAGNEALMALLVRASIVLIVALAGMYVAEKSAMVFSQRTMIVQEQQESMAQKDVSDLEIATTQLQAAHNLTQVASQEHMILPAGAVSYLNVDGDAVAFAR